VWALASPCCGGTRFVEAATAAPPDAEPFVALQRAEGFEVLVRPAGPYRLPDELVVELAGIRRRRLRAYWNGCAFVV